MAATRKATSSRSNRPHRTANFVSTGCRRWLASPPGNVVRGNESERHCRTDGPAGAWIAVAEGAAGIVAGRIKIPDRLALGIEHPRTRVRLESALRAQIAVIDG